MRLRKHILRGYLATVVILTDAGMFVALKGDAGFIKLKGNDSCLTVAIFGNKDIGFMATRSNSSLSPHQFPRPVFPFF